MEILSTENTSTSHLFEYDVDGSFEALFRTDVKIAHLSYQSLKLLWRKLVEDASNLAIQFL